jgi:hypothetical protein
MFEEQIKPILDDPGIELKDKLRTMTLSSAKEIALAITSQKKALQCVVYRRRRIQFIFYFATARSMRRQHHADHPRFDVIKFKEAIVFAFLGMLRVRGESNCLKSVTGAAAIRALVQVLDSRNTCKVLDEPWMTFGAPMEHRAHNLQMHPIIIGTPKNAKDAMVNTVLRFDICRGAPSEP